MRFYPEIDSTNAEALRLAKDGEPGNLWIRAQEQRGGKGRDGRKWQSCEGNLYASLLLKTGCPPTVLTQLSLVAGVAACEALQNLCDERIMQDIRLKWPNDLLCGQAKLGGILLENYQSINSGPTSVVTGIGLNLQGHPEIPDRETASLKALGSDINAEDALTQLARRFASWLTIWNNGSGYEQVRNAWENYGQKKGESIQVHYKSGVIQGNFAGLNASGGMILHLPSGEYKDIHFGDVMLSGEIKKKV